MHTISIVLPAIYYRLSTGGTTGSGLGGLAAGPSPAEHTLKKHQHLPAHTRYCVDLANLTQKAETISL